MKNRLCFITSAVFFTFLGVAAMAQASETPSEGIQETIAYAQSVLNDPTLSESTKKERVKKAAYGRFDFTEMSKRVLAQHWAELTPAEQREFVTLFSELLERVYFNRIKLIQNATFSYSSQEVDKDFAVVRSRAVTSKGETVHIEYRLHFMDRGWKIYDVGVEGISLVSNYRTQFNRIISQNGTREMLKRMREKTQ